MSDLPSGPPDVCPSSRYETVSVQIGLCGQLALSVSDLDGDTDPHAASDPSHAWLSDSRSAIGSAPSADEIVHF